LHGGPQLARISAPRRRKPQLEEIIDAFTHPLLDRSTARRAAAPAGRAILR